MTNALSVTRATLETAQEWEGDYHPVALESHLEREWKVDGDSLPAIQIIQRLTDEQKPLLPEGYIWVEKQHVLQIFKHQHAPTSSFKIHLFGPDSKGRIQFIVEKDHVPQHGFAMTRKEGFPRDLRNEYPMSLESFRSNSVPHWRGHIIDYKDTLGDSDEMNISTLRHWNYKPEPPEYWAQTLRTKAVSDIREIEGSYAEILLYGFSPTKTQGENLIPRAIVLEIFLFTKEFLASYHIPQDHECHGWTARKHHSTKALRELQQRDLFPALIWKPGTRPIIEMEDASIEPEHLNVKTAYSLLRRAEMEYDRATFKILYVIYGKTHQAPLETLQFWLLRTVDIAIKVDYVYRCTRPSFPISLMGRLQDGLHHSLIPYVDLLRTIADRVLQAPSPIGFQVVTPAQEQPQLIEAAATPSDVINDVPINIVCSGPDRDEEAEVRNKIDKAIKTHGEVTLNKVITRWANRFFVTIQQQVQASPKHYQPIRRIEINGKRWQKSVSALALKYFGADVIIIVNQ